MSHNTRTFGLAELTAHLAALDDAGLAALLRARPDLLNPAPADMTGLAARAQSEMSLRHHLQHLDAGTLRLLHALNRGRPLPRPAARTRRRTAWRLCAGQASCWTFRRALRFPPIFPISWSPSRRGPPPPRLPPPGP